MDEIFLPTLHTFENGNVFTGSRGLLRFKITPDVIYTTPAQKEVDMQASSIRCEYWHGIFCYEKSEIEDEKTFPMSEEGRESMRRWLEQNQEKAESAES